MLNCINFCLKNNKQKTVKKEVITKTSEINQININKINQEKSSKKLSDCLDNKNKEEEKPDKDNFILLKNKKDDFILL